ncbi:hypothetical protein WA026_000147 [Henosepilachna vigintioctopunctata]|uniref:C2H2-type domain-containing protein n=1 Tax=Henosepilachna vigintioctopunctata TaxID=420089 RepID=A0AAW1V6B6_9CUCU
MMSNKFPYNYAPNVIHNGHQIRNNQNVPEEWDARNMNPHFYMENSEEHIIPEPLLLTIKEEPMSDEPEVVMPVEPILHEGSFSEDHMEEKAKKRRAKRKIREKPIVDDIARTCQICGKILASVTSLYVHLKSHSKNKPYNCADCGATFTRKYYLEVHLRSHTGERPFECDICHKHFSQKSSLNTHKRKHTGEKPYQCHHCGKSFAAQSYLSSHQWSHFERDQSGSFNCEKCSSNFANRTQLIKHLRVHAGSLEHECKICHKRFSKQSYLIRHEKGSHTGNPQDTSEPNEEVNEGPNDSGDE